MFNVGLIDSLKVRIRKDKIKIIDKRIVEDFIAYYPTISALDDEGNENERLGFDYRKAEPYTKVISGITYRFFFKAFINPRKIAEEYLVLQISAKMVKNQYFDGITAQNYKMIVDDINSFKIIQLDYKTFLEGLVSDIDICINQLIDEKSLKTAFSLIKNHPMPSKSPLLHFIEKSHHIKGIINLGIDFNKREKATNTTPYCKIYHKGIELQSKSYAFYSTYLEKLNKTFLNNLVRYEFTIKASKHKDYLRKQDLLKSEMKTFQDLLNVSPKELTDIAKSGLPHYIEKRSTNQKDYKNLKPTELVIKYLIDELIHSGADTSRLLGFTYLIECPVQRSVTKSKIKKIIELSVTKNKSMERKLKENDCAIEFLNNLGLIEELPF